MNTLTIQHIELSSEVDYICVEEHVEHIELAGYNVVEGDAS